MSPLPPGVPGSPIRVHRFPGYDRVGVRNHGDAVEGARAARTADQLHPAGLRHGQRVSDGGRAGRVTLSRVRHPEGVAGGAVSDGVWGAGT